MNLLRRSAQGLLWLLLFVPALAARAQSPVTASPVFFTDNTPVTLTYDASLGNRALLNFTGNVYIWTGVITNQSTSPSDWKYVKSASFGQPDPAALMTRDAANPNLYRITFTPRTFYGVPAGQTILKLAMIFKDGPGATVGRNADGSDMFVDVFQGGYAVRLTSPAGGGTAQFVAPNTTVSVAGEASASSNLRLTLNGTQVAQQANATALTASVTLTQPGRNVVKLLGTGPSAATAADSAVFVIRPAVNVAALPAGTKEGINYLPGGTSAILNLTAPSKQFVYVLGEWNNFQPDQAGFMNQTPDGNNWWVQINNLQPGREYAYQYLVDGTLRVADPYTEKVLDPANDPFIPAVTYPNLRAYPAGQNAGIMSVLQTNQAPYVWQTTNFVRPARTNLVIYELHLRDFIARHDYQTLRDSLHYLKKLGVNCIELMPVNEFEGNDSWGYNPSFYFAPDKYYGPKNELKRFIDAAHARGIAVVLDMVLNHSCGQSPMVQLYFDNGNPATNSPWFNRTATHPFNVCYDFNHESPFTKRFSKNVMSFWLQEYKIDGYRFDLSKGFTQTNSGNNVGLWSAYDQSRINIWLDYYQHLQSVDPTMYPILEHFADNSEETVLSNAGLMLWGNLNYAYSQAMQGRPGNANFAYGYYATRGWQQPNLVTYMESHDEERLMVNGLTGGIGNGVDYDTRKLYTALKRSEMNAAFFLPIPGPKMIWQFGELGYDVSINQNGRVGAKPIRWAYYTDSLRRRQLYGVYANLAALRNAPAYTAGQFSARFAPQSKTMHQTGPNLNVTVVGNFGVSPDDVDPEFQRTGKWYNYLTGDSITVAGVNDLLTLGPGQYAVYVDRRLARPVTLLGTKKEAAALALQLSVAPNPAARTTTVSYELPAAAAVQVSVHDLLGKTVQTLAPVRQPAGAQSRSVPLDRLAPGVYLVRVQAGERTQTARLLVQ